MRLLFKLLSLSNIIRYKIYRIKQGEVKSYYLILKT